MNKTMTIQIDARFNVEELLGKVKLINEHAGEIEKIAKEIGFFPGMDAEIRMTQIKDGQQAKRYGIKILKSEKDPAKRVTYIFDAVGMTPAAMDFKEDVFKYNSWSGVEFASPANNYPCMVKFDGSEAYKLNPTNYNKKEDGTKSDIKNPSFAGNAMAAFKGGYLAQYEDDKYEYIVWSNVKYDDKYNCYHRTSRDGAILPGFYYRIFTPTSINGIARSLSGYKPIGGESAYEEAEMIEKNGPTWDGLTWSRYNYIISILMIMGKTEDLRTSYGTGNSKGHYYRTGTGVLESGSQNTEGAFYGSNDGMKQIKVFHVEALWGNQFTRCMGLLCCNGKYLVKPYGRFNFDGEGYEEVANCGFNGFDCGFVDKAIMTKYGRFALGFDGSEETYTCNFASVDTREEAAVALVGGGASSGSGCGFYVYLGYSAGAAGWYVAPGLSSEMPLTAQP